MPPKLRAKGTKPQVASPGEVQPRSGGASFYHRGAQIAERVQTADYPLYMLLVGNAVFARGELLELASVGTGDEGPPSASRRTSAYTFSRGRAIVLLTIPAPE